MRPAMLAIPAVWLALAGTAHAGLYCSEEPIAELPSQWRGFLLDQRALRVAAVKPTASIAASPLRKRYEASVGRLVQTAQERRLTADESADVGALYIRLGDLHRALNVLQPAQRENPSHFRLAANLGTAWQLQGDLSQAEICLQQAVRLAPGKYERAEELHLRLVRLRAREVRGAAGLDDLFKIRFVGASGKYEAGKLADDQRKNLPSDAAASLQLLALWLPSDGRLLWQMAELAAANGEIATAAGIMDSCVAEFGMRAPELLDHRRALRRNRAAADQQGDAPAESRRPLQSCVGAAARQQARFTRPAGH